MLNRILLAGAFIVGSAVAAAAADFPSPPPVAPAAPPPPMASPAFDWSGPYVGAYGGALFGFPGGIIGQAGVQAGFNIQRGAFVIGLEAQAGTIFRTGAVAFEGDLNARLGLVISASRVLLYGEAGVMFLSPFGTVWTAGGGLEIALGDRASMFGEAKAICAGGACFGYTFQGGLNFHPGN